MMHGTKPEMKVHGGRADPANPPRAVLSLDAVPSGPPSDPRAGIPLEEGTNISRRTVPHPSTSRWL